MFLSHTQPRRRRGCPYFFDCSPLFKIGRRRAPFIKRAFARTKIHLQQINRGKAPVAPQHIQFVQHRRRVHRVKAERQKRPQHGNCLLRVGLCAGAGAHAVAEQNVLGRAALKACSAVAAERIAPQPDRPDAKRELVARNAFIGALLSCRTQKPCKLTEQRAGDLSCFLAALERQQLRFLRAQRPVNGRAERLLPDADRAETCGKIARICLPLPHDCPGAGRKQATGIVRTFLPALLALDAAAADVVRCTVEDQRRGRLRLRAGQGQLCLHLLQNVRRLHERACRSRCVPPRIRQRKAGEQT